MTVAEALELLGREVLVQDEPRTVGYGRVAQVLPPNQWHIGVYYEQRVLHADRAAGPEPGRWQRGVATDAEVDLMRPDGTWLEPHMADGNAAGPMTWLHVPGDVLLRVVDAVAQYREGGACPCPDCLGWQCGCLDCAADRRARAA